MAVFALVILSLVELVFTERFWLAVSSIVEEFPRSITSKTKKETSILLKTFNYNHKILENEFGNEPDFGQYFSTYENSRLPNKPGFLKFSITKH